MGDRVPLGEADYRALRLMMERSDGPALSKRMHLSKFDKAWKEGRLAMPQGEGSGRRWWRCEARFMLGEYGDYSGWEGRDPWATMIWHANPFDVPVWNPDKRVGRLYVVGEQGIGDEVMFAQCIEDARGLVGEVTVETQERLRGVFERCLGVKTVAANVGGDGLRRKQDFDADAWVAMGDLPRLFRRGKFPRKPYLWAEPDERYVGMTGISWRGAQGEVPEIRALGGLSLQYDQTWDEDAQRPEVDLLSDIEGIMRVLAALDRLVTTSTTVAHLAAAMGVRTDVVIADPKSGVRGNIMPWRWIDLSRQGKSRWYGDHVRTFQSWKEYRACR